MMEMLENLTIHPDVETPEAASGDLLSHVLAQIRLTGDRVSSQSLGEGEALQIGAGEGCVIVVTAGALCAAGDAQAAAVIATGDLLLLPRGHDGACWVASCPGTALVICRFWFDPDSLRGMIFALPRRIHIRHADGAEWIDGMLRFMMIETDDVQPGAALMISRIIDLFVIRALRSWVHRGESSGWVGGLADARIARSLKAIHEKPMQRWSIDALAGLVGMSRSSFCERFTALVGRSPLRYQNEWRLGLARDMLTRRDARVGEVGLRIGYASEAAFSRAYKQFFGHAPRLEYAVRSEPKPARQPA